LDRAGESPERRTKFSAEAELKLMNYLSLAEYAEVSERILEIFDLAGNIARSNGIFVSNPANGGIGNKITSSL
jgi:hypothetical protein